MLCLVQSISFTCQHFQTTGRKLGDSGDAPKKRMFRSPWQTMFLPALTCYQFLFVCHRCRLSASPATGLVGMQENGFLSDFFGCVGFLPLTTHRCRELRFCCCLHVMQSPSCLRLDSIPTAFPGVRPCGGRYIVVITPCLLLHEAHAKLARKRKAGVSFKARSS